MIETATTFAIAYLHLQWCQPSQPSPVHQIPGLASPETFLLSYSGRSFDLVAGFLSILKYGWFMGYESWRYGNLHELLQNSGKNHWDIHGIWLGNSINSGESFIKKWWPIIWRLNYPSKRQVFLRIENKPFCQLFVFGIGWTTNINHWVKIENNTQLRCQLVVEV